MFSPFSSRESFLVLEILPSGTNGLFLSVDEDHSLALERFVEGVDLERFLKSPLRRAAQQSWEGQYLFKDHRRVVAVADPAVATTVPIPVALVREAADVPHAITASELENLITQEVAKMLNACRTEAAARLGVDELDAVLVSEKARHFKVDGNEVQDPCGISGKKITLLLEFTFTGRTFFEILKPFFNAPDDFYFMEAPQSRLSAIARIHPLPLSLIAAGEDLPSSLAILEAHTRRRETYPVLYRESFSWNFENLFTHIQEALGVSGTVARELYGLFIEDELSPHAMRMFARIIHDPFEELLREVDAHKLAGTVYVDAPHALPFAMPYRHGKAMFEPLPLDELLVHMGFEEVKGLALSRYVRGRFLLPFVEAYFDKSGIEINHKLRRRLHWLAM